MLVEVVEAGGFSAASQRTGIPKSRLSRRIAALEERLGVALLMRNTRHFEVTEMGKEMFQRGLKIRDETRTALAMAQEGRGEPSGLLRVACPIALAWFLISDVAIAFARAYDRQLRGDELRAADVADGPIPAVRLAPKRSLQREPIQFPVVARRRRPSC